MNFQPLKDFLDYYLQSIGVPGSDTVVWKGREEVFRYQSGYDSLRLHTPVRPDALYYLYSVSKVTTAVAAMQLIERGQILVTDPLYAYFPEYRRMYIRRKGNDGMESVEEAQRPILIRHLLNMTSGMGYALDTASVRRVREQTGGRCPTLDVVRAYAEEPLAFEPGENFLYSFGLDVMAGIVELVSGQKFGDYCKEHIFDPLGMKDTTFGITEDRLPRLATHYSYQPRNCCAMEISPLDNPYILGTEYQSGGAGIVSTVEDQILLADALTHLGLAKNGNRILSSYAVERLRTNCLSDDMITGLGRSFGTNHNIGYGYGYGVRTNLFPEEAGNLMPVGEFGWDGAKLSYLSACPESEISIFHAEHMGGLHGVVIPRLRNCVYSCLGV